MIKVLIVDDSAVVRQVLTKQLATVSGLQVIGAVRDPIFALRHMEKEWPDVIILDIEMPRMDGITFLKKIMSEHPTPVVICSTLTVKGAEVAMQALASGAVDIITKPKAGLKDFLQDSKTLLVHAVKGAAQSKLSRIKPMASGSRMPVTTKHNADVMLAQSLSKPMTKTTDRVIAIGTSTGGTQALESVLTQLPRNIPGIVVVQHMPEEFTKAFSLRLDNLCEIKVKEAETNDRVIPGQVLIANGGRHMLLRRSGAQYRVELKDGPLVSRHRPSVDVLFRSVASTAGANAIGIIMTGMGDDGAHGLKEMHDAGAYTLAQDEKSCIVYGMPKEAVKIGGVDKEISLRDIPSFIKSQTI
ncbi:MAG: chemotaxis response regulator protein-glutamate methylesterase [Candidatus Thiodiazotropha sp.]